MFENNSPLVRQSNIFKKIFVFQRDEKIDIPSEFDELSNHIVSEFEKYDVSARFVFDIYHLYSSMYYKQFFAAMNLLPNAMDMANFGKTKTRNKNTINRSTGDLAANLYINKLFGLEKIEPYMSVLSLIPETKRSNYILYFAACFCLNENVGKFKSYLTKAQISTFEKTSTRTNAIRSVGENLFREKEALSLRLGEINSEYHEKGFIYLENGSVELMDFDEWANQNGYEVECNSIEKSLENLSIPLEDIINVGISS